MYWIYRINTLSEMNEWPTDPAWASVWSSRLEHAAIELNRSTEMYTKEMKSVGHCLKESNVWNVTLKCVVLSASALEWFFFKRLHKFFVSKHTLLLKVYKLLLWTVMITGVRCGKTCFYTHTHCYSSWWVNASNSELYLNIFLRTVKYLKTQKNKKHITWHRNIRQGWG